MVQKCLDPVPAGNKVPVGRVANVQNLLHAPLESVVVDNPLEYPPFGFLTAQLAAEEVLVDELVYIQVVEDLSEARVEVGSDHDGQIGSGFSKTAQIGGYLSEEIVTTC